MNNEYYNNGRGSQECIERCAPVMYDRYRFVLYGKWLECSALFYTRVFACTSVSLYMQATYHMPRTLANALTLRVQNEASLLKKK